MEIERKYLVKFVPEQVAFKKGLRVTQAFINLSPVIRIRSCDNRYYLTCKGKGNLIRDEWQIEINKDDFEHLWTKVEGNVVYKDRLRVPIGSRLFAEYDIYYEHLEGLKTIEVEFKTIEQANEFVPPDWFGTEITFDSRFSNSNLSLINNDEIKNILDEYVK